jgi:hypothetical protein
MCVCGSRIDVDDQAEHGACQVCQRRYRKVGQMVSLLSKSPAPSPSLPPGEGVPALVPSPLAGEGEDGGG